MVKATIEDLAILRRLSREPNEVGAEKDDERMALKICTGAKPFLKA